MRACVCVRARLSVCVCVCVNAWLILVVRVSLCLHLNHHVKLQNDEGSRITGCFSHELAQKPSKTHQPFVLTALLRRFSWDHEVYRTLGFRV